MKKAEFYTIFHPQVLMQTALIWTSGVDILKVPCDRMNDFFFMETHKENMT